MNKPLYESFSWFRDDFKTTSQVGSKLRIKGKALYATVSGNHRKYVDEELLRSARTLAGKPVTLNHDMNMKIGHVLDADYEDGFIEYVAEINDGEYVRKIRDKFNIDEDAYFIRWGKEPVYGVSVEANYRYHDEDCIGGTCAVEPHGIIFSALSIVEDPEKPGVSGTTLGLMEMSLTEAQVVSKMLGDYAEFHGMPKRLFESYNHNVVSKFEEKKTLEKTSKKAKEAKTHKDIIAAIPVSADPRAGFLMEQEEPEPCPEGEHRNEAGDCVPNESATEQDIKPGSHYCEEHPDDPRCKEHKAKIHGASEQEDEPCPEGEKRNEEGDCIPTATEQEGGCPEGEHKDDMGNCVPDQPPHATVPEFPAVAPTTPTSPIPAVAEFRLGEPFADYADMDDCISKNPDKEDPAAYCASIKQQTEGETLKRQLLGEIKRINQRLTILERSTKTVTQAKEINELKSRQQQKDVDERLKQVTEQLKQLGFSIESIRQTQQTVKAQHNSDLSSMKKRFTQTKKQRDSDVSVTKKAFETVDHRINGTTKKVGELIGWRAQKDTLDGRQCASIKALNTDIGTTNSTVNQLGESMKRTVNALSGLSGRDHKIAETVKCLSSAVSGLNETQKLNRTTTVNRLDLLEKTTTNTSSQLEEFGKKYPVLEKAYEQLNTNYVDFTKKHEAEIQQLNAKKGEKLKETQDANKKLEEIQGQIDTLKKHIPANFKSTIQKPDEAATLEAVPTRHT